MGLCSWGCRVDHEWIIIDRQTRWWRWTTSEKIWLLLSCVCLCLLSSTTSSSKKQQKQKREKQSGIASRAVHSCAGEEGGSHSTHWLYMFPVFSSWEKSAASSWYSVFAACFLLPACCVNACVFFRWPLFDGRGSKRRNGNGKGACELHVIMCTR